MGMYVQNTPKCLRHGDDPGTGFWVTGGFAQQLVDGLISKANEISEQLAFDVALTGIHFRRWEGSIQSCGERDLGSYRAEGLDPAGEADGSLLS